jgi:hypothetical protein
MRAECVSAVQMAAQQMGKTLTAADLRGIETKIYEARKQLAKADPNTYRQMTTEQQLAKAGERVVNDAIHNAIKKRQRAELTVIASAKKDAALAAMEASGLDKMEALRRYTAYVSDGKGGIQSMESYTNGLTHSYLRKIPAFFQLMEESSFAGIQTSAKNSMDYVKESFGIDSGNPLAKKAWQQVDAARRESIDHFNRVGGDVAPLANYRNPQASDAYKVSRRGGKKGEDYVNDYMQWVDRDEYFNPDGTRMTDAQMKDFLLESFVTIKTDGANKLPGEGGGTGSVANRMKAHRQIHYKSPEAYMAAMEKYGAGNLDDQIRGSFQSIAGDISLVEKFGPNAIHSFNTTYSEAVKATLGKGDRILQDAFKNMTGQKTTISVVIARWFAELRAAMVASRLGSMLLSQMADAGTAQAVTRSLNIPTSELLEWVGRAGSDSEARAMARLHGLGLESALNNISRFAADASTTGVFGKAASVIPTIQGANLWTSVWRQGFGLMLEAKLGDMTAKYSDWSKLPEPDRKIFESLGINDKDFAIWKLAQPTEYKGNRILGPDSIENIPTSEIKDLMGLRTMREAEIARQEAAVKLVTFTVEQSHQAVLQPGALSQATLTGSTSRGDIFGEIGKTLTQFKSFPMAFTRQMLMERANFAAAGGNPWVFRAKLLGVTSILGGMSLILNDIVSGKDPRQIWDSNDPLKVITFGTQAIVKGGGLGFFGDVMEAFRGGAENPLRQATGLLGPAGGYVASSVLPAAGKGVAALVTQDEKHIQEFNRYAYESVKGITPGQNLWFIKGFLHNIMLDDLQEMASPGYKQRAKQRAMKNYDQGYWMGMDEETRTPNFGNMIAQ